jgi:hypothetical protein
MVFGMNLMPSKVIGREACLCARGFSKLSKDPRPKRCLNIWGREESKEVDSMKVEKKSVHRKRYEDCCMK